MYREEYVACLKSGDKVPIEQWGTYYTDAYKSEWVTESCCISEDVK